MRHEYGLTGKGKRKGMIDKRFQKRNEILLAQKDIERTEERKTIMHITRQNGRKPVGKIKEPHLPYARYLI